MSPLKRITLTFTLLPILLGGGCSDEDTTGAVTTIEVWAHAGQQSERRTLGAQVARFNAQQAGTFRIELTLIPEGSYNDQVQAAAVAGELPDLLEFDGPFLYTYAWQGRLRTLDDLLSQSLLDDLLPSILEQGRYHDRLWAVGTFDSGLGLYADRRTLQEVGARIPSLDAPWSIDEFDALIEQLAATDPDAQVLDLKLNYAGEWYTYAMSPLLQSAGGDLIDRDAQQAAGILDGPASIAAMTTIQNWIKKGRIDPNIDDAAFTSGRVALALGGHWNYPRYHDKLGDNLLLLPLPDFGEGPKSGQGSWCWAMTADSRHPNEAAAFLSFLLKTDEVLAMSEANSAVPASYRAIARSPRYREGGVLRLFVEQLQQGYSVPRPQTPAYPVITAEFQKVVVRIRAGASVQQSLTTAAKEIDREIADNRGYPLVGRAKEEVER
ncbi:extracellular solute-binding protein [Methylophaga sp. OBS4]|uniref:extracellular solute-binding protein n=1 Tax=Methylophaga sp. OBS4 TaxID=2991935 RepID=UPI0022574F68|nr:extracellular solute-binding protein [Methylophaga sp. OBS4]MCX4188009.1 extracellular solute-binding protein [Methylophaga sp. OBS4]